MSIRKRSQRVEEEDDGQWGAFADHRRVLEGYNDHEYYTDLIQPVLIDCKKGNVYEGVILDLPEGDKQHAYGVYKRHELRDVRPITDRDVQDWNVGDRVEFRVTEPRYGTDYDGTRIEIYDGGSLDRRRVWCLGTVKKVGKKGKYVIEHCAWDLRDLDKKTTTVVDKANLRNDLRK